MTQYAKMWLYELRIAAVIIFAQGLVGIKKLGLRLYGKSNKGSRNDDGNETGRLIVRRYSASFIPRRTAMAAIQSLCAIYFSMISIVRYMNSFADRRQPLPESEVKPLTVRVSVMS